MIEAGVVLDLRGEPLHWHLPPGRSGGSLPDSRDLWDVLWDNREKISGFAHSHPGAGQPGPSWEDVTTFSAVELALGKRLDWWITSSDQVALFKWFGPGPYTYHRARLHPFIDLPWVAELRRLSQ